MERAGESGEVQDELSIEVTETDKGSDRFYQSQWFPLFDSLKFGGVHKYFSVLDYLLCVAYQRTPWILLRLDRRYSSMLVLRRSRILIHYKGSSI